MPTRSLVPLSKASAQVFVCVRGRGESGEFVSRAYTYFCRSVNGMGSLAFLFFCFLFFSFLFSSFLFSSLLFSSQPTVSLPVSYTPLSSCLGERGSGRAFPH